MTHLPLAELLGIAELLEVRFPDHNDGFAYASRLSEETGELIEAHLACEQTAIIAESQDVLRVSVGLMAHYSLLDSLPDDLLVLGPPHTPGDIRNETLWLSRYTGRTCSAINHAENTGIKRAKHGPTEHQRLQTNITGLIGTVIGLIGRYDAAAELSMQIHAAYQRYAAVTV